MSGGHWDYAGSKVRDALANLSEDKQAKRRWPCLASLLGRLAEVIYDLEHRMDWALSGDHLIENDEEFDKKAVGLILECAMKAAPDKWFPRGKWATIQAVQGRMEE
jgi:hypothetical protein